MKIFKTNNRIIKSWCENPEEGAIEQAKNLASLPFIYKHIALMPDTHQGYGMPIGGVIATDGIVIPNAVGVDIGCGVLAVKTNIKDLPKGKLKDILNSIKEVVPVGFNHHQKPQNKKHIPDNWEKLNIVNQEIDNMLLQVGTLGGGNHFIEIQQDTEGFIWFMLHSGSRNLGYKIANYYNNIAKKLNKKWFSVVSNKIDLAFLPIDTQEGQDYIKEMNYALEFAKSNRELMSARIKESFLKHINCAFTDEINIHHNYARLENHYGKNVWVHRKGATSARENETGIIPGSQGSKSYIVRGLGNKESFMSCSHGAGRKMGRRQAIKELNLEEEQKKMKGILHSVNSINQLDESVGAYKNIDVVIQEQKDLVEIVTALTPLGVIKG